MEAEILQWLLSAETDLNVAQHLFETYYPKPIEIICYHCQQSAEKAIKALILSMETGEGIPKKHDLSFLLQQIKNRIAIPDAIYDCADTLTPYGVSVRYPNELNLSEQNAKNAVLRAEQILQWVKSNISYETQQ